MWNVQAIRTSVNRLQSLVRRYHLYILVIIEPKARVSLLLSYRLQLGFPQTLSVNDNIWIFWRDSFLQLEEQRPSLQNHSMKFLWLPAHDMFWCTFVCGLHTIAARRPLWSNLQVFHASLDIPWLLGGDFNTYLTIDEHKGMSSPSLRTL